MRDRAAIPSLQNPSKLKLHQLLRLIARGSPGVNPMPRPLSWLPRLHVIRRTVANSVRSHYDRRELETLFELQPDRPEAETSGEQERQL